MYVNYVCVLVGQILTLVWSGLESAEHTMQLLWVWVRLKMREWLCYAHTIIIIREYGSGKTVGWHGKKMAAHTFQLQVMS